jgi:flagellar hook-associated protein 1 FlgK
MHDLDTIAASLVTTVNGIHSQGQGQDPVNDVNLNFFDPASLTAGTIKLSTDVDGQPSRIALGAAGAGVLDGAIGHQLGTAGALTTSPDALHRAMIGKLGVEAQTASSRAATQAKFVVEAENERTSVSGVNLDEEMTNLVISQRAYESSARLLSTVDEMLDTLINRTGAH